MSSPNALRARLIPPVFIRPYILLHLYRIFRPGKSAVLLDEFSYLKGELNLYIYERARAILHLILQG